MSFIQNGVRKPKNIAAITVKKMSYSAEVSLEDIRNFIKGEKSSKLESKLANAGVDIKTLKNVEFNFTIQKGAGKNVDVFMTTTKSARKEYRVNIYLIEIKNIDAEKTVQGRSLESGDTISLSPKAWFETQEVFKDGFKMFFNKKTKGLVVMSHPKDIEEAEDSKDLIAVNVEGMDISETAGKVTISQCENMKVLSSKDRHDSEIKALNANRMVVKIGKITSMKDKNSFDAVKFKGEGKRVQNISVTCVNFNAKMDLLEDGKYNIFDENTNHELWMVVKTTATLTSKVREVVVFEKNQLPESAEVLETRNMIAA